jgi:hypothetical protein
MDIEKVWPGKIVHALLAISSNPIKDMAIPLSCCSILMFMLEGEKISAMSPSIIYDSYYSRAVFLLRTGLLRSPSLGKPP